MPDFNGKTVVIDTLQSKCSAKHTCAWTPYNGKICEAKRSGSYSGSNGAEYNLFEGDRAFNPGHICHEVCLRLGKPEPGILDWPE